MSIEQIVAFTIIFCIGWGIAIATRWSKILTLLVLLSAGYVLFANSAYKELLQHHFRHPILYGYLGLAWGYFRNPRWRGFGYRFNLSATIIFLTPFRVLKNLLHFFFVKLPVFTIRLIYWLSKTIKNLSSVEGWQNLFWGLWQWLIYLIPQEIRDEWHNTFGNRKAGRTGKTYSRTKTDYQESNQRTHDRTSTDEAEQREQERQRREYQQAEENRRQRERQRAEQQADRARQAQNKAKEKKQKTDDRKNAKAYAEAGWNMRDFETENERFFSKCFEPHVILGTSPDMTKAQKRKKYHQLAKKYMTYCQPYQPIPVQERATEIMKKINQVKEQIIGK